MIFLYNIAIHFFGWSISVAAFFGNEKAKKWKLGRRNLFQNLNKKIDKNQLPLVWFHVSSLGEYEMAKPLIDKIKKSNTFQILVSFFSPSGYEYVNEEDEGIIKTYMPLDKKRIAKKFIDLIQADKAIFVKNDLWLNHLNAANQRGVESYLISGDFRKNQIYFKWYGGLFRKVLKDFKAILVQHQPAVKLLNDKGISRVLFSGDIRMDRTLDIKNEGKEIAQMKYFLDGRDCIVLGSCWEQEIELMESYYQKNKGRFQVIIAPHDISEENIRDINDRFPEAVLFSQLNAESGISDILIVDGIGQLKYLYQYAQLAIVGGAWGKGLHNILEAAVFGIPVVFGPKIKNHPEAEDLIAYGGAKKVINKSDFDSILDQCFFNEKTRMEMGEKAARFIEQNKGALQKSYETIFNA